MKQQPKMQTFNLLSATNKIEKLVSKHVQVYNIELGFRRNGNCFVLFCMICYTEKYDNFTANVYDFRAELTLANLILEIEKELKYYNLFKE